jgi:hypothetical protein
VSESLSYNAGAHPQPEWCTSIRGSDGDAAEIRRQPTSDPLAGSDIPAAAETQLARTAALPPPADIVVPAGPDIDFGWNQGATRAQAEAAGCTATFESGARTWTFACPEMSRVGLGDVTLAGGLTLDFNPGGAASVVYDISGGIRNNGARMDFAGGTYNVADGLVTGGGSITEFGPGSYRIGRAGDSCDGARYSICNKGRLSFAGPSDFVLPGGVRNGSGMTLTLGTGDGNSFRLGPSSRGDALSIGGGSETYLGDATGGVFEVSGRIDGGGGGSCVELPATDIHEIDGSVVASGAVRFGSGLYVVNGYMHIGGAGGGGGSCRGETVSVEADEVTFLVSAAGAEPGGWSCARQAFCVSAGYSDIRITAPRTGVFTDIAAIGPLDAGLEAGAAFTAGASGSVVRGAFYFPNDRIALSGGASASGGGGCLQLIGAEIEMSGGASAASQCDLPGASGAGQVVILR